MRLFLLASMVVVGCHQTHVSLPAQESPTAPEETGVPAVAQTPPPLVVRAEPATDSPPEIAYERGPLSHVEDELLALINAERNGEGRPDLVRRPGLSRIIAWHVQSMARERFLNHADNEGRRGEARARYFGGDPDARCVELIQWWGKTPSGRVHYEKYVASEKHHQGFLEKGIYNLGPTTHVGISVVEGKGPADSKFVDRTGSYSGVLLCDRQLTIEIDPFDEQTPTDGRENLASLERELTGGGVSRAAENAAGRAYARLYETLIFEGDLESVEAAVNHLGVADEKALLGFAWMLRNECSRKKCVPSSNISSRIIQVIAGRFGPSYPCFATDELRVKAVSRAAMIICSLSPSTACDKPLRRAPWAREHRLFQVLLATQVKDDLPPRPDLRERRKTTFDGRRAARVFVHGSDDETRGVARELTLGIVRDGDRVNLKKLWPALAKRAATDSELAWSLRVVVQPRERGGGISVIVSARPHCQSSGPTHLASGYQLLDTGRGYTHFRVEARVRRESSAILEAWVNLGPGGGEFFLESWRGESSSKRCRAPLTGSREGAIETPSQMSEAKYFSSPKEAVPAIAELLRKEDFKTLSRYYDLSGSQIAKTQLESGDFFIRTENTEVSHPGGFSRYKHPFAPGFTYSSMQSTDRGGVHIIRVEMTIEQGEGIPDQVGFSSFSMMKSELGWQILPRTLHTAVLPAQTDLLSR